MTEDTSDICSVTGKIHEPNWNNISVEFDGLDKYVDVPCKDCGRSGCVGNMEMLKKGIIWE
jgi:hypothetical protein